MDGYKYLPPNPLLLSEEVIGSVVQRRQVLSRCQFAGKVSNQETQGNKTSEKPPRKKNVLETATVALDVARGCFQQTLQQVSRTRKDDIHQLQGINDDWDQFTHSTAEEAQNKAMAELKAAQKVFVRALRRVKQIRYRSRTTDKLDVVRAAIQHLQEDIDKLEQRRHGVSSRCLQKESVWSVALEYFRLFRNGLRQPTPLSINSSSQLDFVRTSMAVDVVFNGGHGADAVIRNWVCLSNWFDNFQVELDSLDKGAAGSVVAAITTRATVTERTLCNVFLTLCGSDGILADKLLGQRIIMRGQTHFQWDTASERVTCIRSESDMLTPLLELLGDLEDLSRVFDKALITPDFLLSPWPEGHS